ncbi:MAG: carboxypeptidase-like regulatory domain-containing protein [Acidobacteriota bacterium]
MRFPILVLAATLAFAPAAQAQVARISGTVKTDQGEPVKGAVITARNAGAQPTEFTSTTDEKGEWAMLGLRFGIWSVIVMADGYEAARGDVRVSSFDRNRRFDFILAPMRIGGLLGRLDADAIQAGLKKADEHAAARHWDEAIEAYRTILKEVPALTAVYLPLGRTCRDAGRLNDAVAAFTTYLALHARSQIALLELGRTHLAAGDPAAATAMLTQAIDVNPATANAAAARALLDQMK